MSRHTYAELAPILGVKRGTLKRWHHEGMPAVFSSQSRVVFDLEQVRAWIDARRAHTNTRKRLRSVSFHRESWVYFAHVPTGLVKIGFTSDLARRSYEEDLDIVAALPGDKRIEALFHRVFEADRVDREFFAPSERLLAFITSLSALQIRRAA